ncbi:cellobiose dehydrogenase [Xylaria bambusicola]|uniref:cellobiose dehydrogenase n=1 Tax=Xylaria bambusicola TaxID=326684 RepID=UPI0020087A18|nr:cellobiose dehydrogenase [Xylaria bambusicola]KAI0514464.1 cellobiose dehydrogenase [Xylaria bambusicola]
MPSVSRIATAVLAAAATIRTCLAQDPVSYTDPDSKIEFGTWQQGDMTIGLSLPSDALTTDATEFVGYLKCSTGWCGLSLGQSGQMTQALLLVAWVNGDEVLTSFRFATGYNFPEEYKGSANLTQISSKVTDTGFELIYRCQDCFSWDHDGATGGVSTSSGFLVLGRASAKSVPSNPSCPSKIAYGQHDTFGQFGAPLATTVKDSYAAWARLATKVVPGDCGTTDPGSPTPDPVATCHPEMANQTFDYIIVGGGAGGIPVADRLSEKGHSVLLLEKGPPSLGMWGGNMKPLWLEKTDLTRFDVPGLCNQIWVDSAGVACKDTDQMAGCVLGGGTAVNAGLWWKANPKDWDENFPAGWHDADLKAATQKVFQRIPGTTKPSMDSKVYFAQGVNLLSAALKQGGWTGVDIPNNSPGAKNHTYSPTTYMFAGGERSGPMATYLKTAAARDNFQLWMNTPARRALRTSGTVTGVELDCTVANGQYGTVSVTPKTGRVIVSAGTFGSAKFLMRSGIGPQDQLEIVKSSKDGPNMIAKDSWINLPVGYNLVDHVNTDTFITHPDVIFYDFYEAWTKPIPSDRSAYLQKRTGILAQSAPNIGPVFWEEVTGPDGKVRQFQWTARIEGADQTGSNSTMIMSQYLGRGSTSRGRMTIRQGLDTFVSDPPYLKDENDKLAIITSIDNLRKGLSKYPNLKFAFPPMNQTVKDYVDGIVVSAAKRRANHWLGTNKMGLDDGRKANGTAVVDLNTKVYGTDNLFVVDGSIFPGMVTANPSAMIVTASENAAARILALKKGPRPRPVHHRKGAVILTL